MNCACHALDAFNVIVYNNVNFFTIDDSQKRAVWLQQLDSLTLDANLGIPPLILPVGFEYRFCCCLGREVSHNNISYLQNRDR